MKAIIEDLYANGSDWGIDLDGALSEAEECFVTDVLEEGYVLEAFEAGGKQRAIVRGYRTVVGALEPNPWNPNQMTDRQSEALGESLHQYGQVLECVVCVAGDGLMIVDGEHRYRDSKEMAARPVSVNVLLGYSEPELMNLTVILNETRGSADEDKLAQLLGKVKPQLEGSWAVGLPYERDYIDNLLANFKPSIDEALDSLRPESDADMFPSEGGEAIELEGAGDRAAVDEPEHYKEVTLKMPLSKYKALAKAHSDIAYLRSLDSDEAIAWGQVVAIMAASFHENGGATQLEY